MGGLAAGRGSQNSKDPGPEGTALIHPRFRLRLRLVDRSPTGRRVEPTARRGGDEGGNFYQQCSGVPPEADQVSETEVDPLDRSRSRNVLSFTGVDL
jgi:hypothetical protein